MKTKQEILRDILSHKYYVRGECIRDGCGRQFERCTNSVKGLKAACCSDGCYQTVRAEKIKRSREIHHYEVFKDGQYYYVREDGKFIERRTPRGGCRDIGLNSSLTIPPGAVKIIDKTSPYLYDDEHPFKDWAHIPPLKEQVTIPTTKQS